MGASSFLHVNSLWVQFSSLYIYIYLSFGNVKVNKNRTMAEAMSARFFGRNDENFEASLFNKFPVIFLTFLCA